MNDAAIHIRFDGNGRVYHPGETLSGEYWLDSIDPSEVRALEISILWYTEGKGDEDLSVHDFHRVVVEEHAGDAADCRGRFSTVLPNSPLSYEGQIIKVRWCARLRVFLRGREIVGQHRFRLGSVPPARIAKP
jgi:hypothetical protein